MTLRTCSRCGWPWDGLSIGNVPARRGYCNVCWYAELQALTPEQLRERAACPGHDFGSNDGQPIDDHCSHCSAPWA